MDRKSAFARLRNGTRRLRILLLSAFVIWGTTVFCNFPMEGREQTPYPPALTPIVTPNLLTPIYPTTTISATETSEINPGLLRFPDGGHDGLNCQNGASAPGMLTSEVDIRAGWVVKENDLYLFHIEFSEVDNLAPVIKQESVDFLGGIEFYDQNGGLPEKDEDWYFNQTGNISFNFAWNKEFEKLLAWRAEYQDGKWLVDQGAYYPISITGNILQVTVPVFEVPENSNWMVVASNYASCDVLGMKDGLPGLPLP